MNTAQIIQIFIIIFSGSAVYLVGGRKKSWQKWGYLAGLLGQPFWIWTTITNQQWGMLILCLFYGFSWSRGLWNHWIAPTRALQKQRKINDQKERELHDEVQAYAEQHGMTWPDACMELQRQRMDKDLQQIQQHL